MPKSRRRYIPKKKISNKKKPKPYEVIKHKFVQFETPSLEHIPFDEKTKAICEIGINASIEFENEYVKLINYFENYDALYLCSFSSYYFMKQKEGIDEEAINGHIEFPPFFLETLQCISLKSLRKITGKPLHDKIEDFKTTIQNLNRNQSYSYLKLLENVKNQDDLAVIMLRTEMMTNTLAVRNWAYIHQMENIAFELSNLIENKFLKSQGFSPKNFLEILFSLVTLTEKKLNIHYRKTLSFAKEKSYTDVFNRYEEKFNEIEKNDQASREKIWKMVGKKVENLKGMLLEHSDYFLTEIFSHNSNEIYNHISRKIPEKEISNILDKISYNFGDLSDFNKDYIFLDNPIHSKPFIKIEENTYFSIIAHMFSHLGVNLLEKFIQNDIDLNKEYTLQKGKYLENKVEKLFKDAFPNAQVLSGSLWRCPILQKDFENDLIVLIDDFAIIIECKSGIVSSPAKRGATDRLFKTLKELIVEPSEQAIRFENYLKNEKRIHQFQTKSKKINVINSDKIKYYVPIGITLSNLGSIGCNLKKLINSKIISHKLNELAPSISLTDLEIIFELLPLEAEKIHYLSRRREFEAHLDFQGDEMDLFGFYLDNGFNIGEVEYNGSNYINMTLKSKEIDPYIIGKHRGVKVKKPSLQKTKYWNDILTKLEDKGNNWLVSSYILLNLPKEDQIKYEKNLKKLMKMIIEGKCEKKHNWMEMFCGSERRKYVIVGFPYLNIDKTTRNTVINEIVASLENKNVRGILILGYDLDSHNYPYSVIAGSLKTELFDSLELN